MLVRLPIKLNNKRASASVTVNQDKWENGQWHY